ncbi:MAG: ankyrin repeat domain-containing protein [Gammaproteobacteria bacterium]
MEHLIEAVISDNSEALRELLWAGANPNQVEDYANITLLHFAAQHNALKCAEVLLKAGADVEAETVDGMNCVNVASLHAHEDMLSLLWRYRGALH